MGRELNKGEASHDLSRFLWFGKEGGIRGHEFGDQVHTFSCLSVLHNAVVAWNTIQIGGKSASCGPKDSRSRTKPDHATPLIRRHINPFGRYHFDLSRMRQETMARGPEANPLTEVFGPMCLILDNAAPSE